MWLVTAPKLGWANATSMEGMAAYLFMWGLFTFVMFIGTLKLNRALQVVFLSLTILFWMLAARDLSGNTALGTAAGYEGIFCGFSAIYTGLAQVLNECYGKVVLPLGPVKKT